MTSPQPANDNRPASFDAMLTRLYPRVRNYATRYRSHDADDLAQTAMESACRNWRSYRQGTSMMPWLVGYVMNAARAPLPLPTNDAVLVRISVPAQQDHVVMLGQVMALLHPSERAEVARIADGGTVKELSEAANISLKKARSLVDHTRQRMREVAALAA